MKICGIIGTTLIDFPGRVATALFTAGCNFRCPFCHNPSLVKVANGCQAISRDTILKELARRRGFLDGVIVSGGEPMIQPDLVDFLTELRAVGLAIKIDTNGSRPNMLREVLARDLADFISMDLKATREKYALAAGIDVKAAKIDESIALIIRSGKEHEFRTTMVPGIVAAEDIRSMMPRISGAKRFVLQQFRPDVTLDPKMKAVQPYPESRLHDAANSAREFIPEVDLRGV